MARVDLHAWRALTPGAGAGEHGRMLGLERFVACAACGCHARPTEPACPFCGARLRSDDGGFARTASAALLGLTAAFAAVVPSMGCSSEETTGDDGQGGGSWSSSSYANVSSSSTYGAGPTFATTGPTTGSSGGDGGAGASGGDGGHGGGGGGAPVDCTAPEPEHCVACCAVGDPAAATAHETAITTACGCALDGPCLGACSDNACAGASAEADCTACLEGLPSSEPCIADATDVCAADPACAPLLDCYAGCPP